MGCRRFGKGKSGSTIDVMLGKLAGSATELYPAEPVSKVSDKRRTTRAGADPYTVTIKEQLSGDKASHVCAEDAAKSLASAIAAKLSEG